ncbi:MAG: hypothetical protein K2I69_08585 [Muribaculaceae bacterium]|nr:hypothetical protein [Muribaculaceae bacterium]
MKASLYLHPDCIRYDSIESAAVFVNKFSNLIKDIAELINDDYGDMVFVYSENLYNTYIFENQDIYTFAFEHLDPDSRAFLFLVLSQQGQSLSFSPKDIELKSVFTRDEDSCHALIVLNKPDNNNSNVEYIQFEKYELIYNKHSWLTLRRQILGNHPGSPADFMKKANRYFPNIVFSPHCEDVIEFYLSVVPRKIVYYLSCMNDRLIGFWNSHPNKNSVDCVCEDFAGQFGMDRAGSPQGTPSKKELYTFEFSKGTDTVHICCGPHFKITHIDNNCRESTVQKSEKFHARIYFKIQDNKIYVGSIGPHI